MADRLEFRIHGMDCADEVAILKREIEPMVRESGRLSFDILRGKMNVEQGDPPVTVAGLAQAVARTGMRAESWQDVKPETSDASFWQRRGRTVLTALCGVLTAMAFATHAVRVGPLAALGSEGTGLSDAAPPMIAVALYVAAIVAGGWYVAPRAFNALRRLRPDMNLLMAIAVVGAAGISEWFEAAVVTFLFALSLALGIMERQPRAEGG